MVRLVNVRMRSTFLLVQFLSTCSGIAFKEPEECHSKNGELNVTLEFGHVTIPKDRTGLPGNLQMLGFNVPGKPGRSPGPTLRVRAGDTLRILLKNTMTPELVSTRSVRNGYHGFDTVNLHTHGLHISPLAPGDEVVNTKVLPGETYEYTYHIPKDHMGGTHWYHPHGHGAVSIHVNFGAAGMIIVEDALHQLPGELLDHVVHKGPVEDYIVAAYHVDFDDITTIANGYVKNCICMNKTACSELFDRVDSAYIQASGDDHDNGENCKFAKDEQTNETLCDEYDVLCIEENCKGIGENANVQPPLCAAQAEPFFKNPEGYTLPGSQLLLANGQLEPTLNITADTWVRLRLGFMATRQYLAPVLDGCQMLLLAKDGVYLPIAPRAIKQGLLASGNRADVLINCPAGEFNFNSTRPEFPKDSEFDGEENEDGAIEAVLLHIRSVDRGAAPQCDLPVFEVNRPCYLVDLRGQEVAKNLTFTMGQKPPKLDFVVINASSKVLQFEPNDVQYTVPVGEAVGFDLANVDVHPFHIHINPFQLTEDQVDGNTWLKDWFKSGDWHDTLFIPYRNNVTGTGAGASQRVLMQTDYFTGPTVVHCHRLMHEDQGMMITINFTGSEGTRFAPAYGNPETCRAIPETCITPSTPLIDPECYSNSLAVRKAKVSHGTRVGNCPLASPPPPSILVTTEAKAATATAEAHTWKVTAIVLGLVLAAVLLLVAAVFLVIRATANSGVAASSAAPETELM